MRLVVATAVLLAFAVPVQAQSRLPRTSPTERQLNEINRNLRQEQRQLRAQEQYQIDRNQLRQRIDRNQTFSNPSPPARIGTCPAGSVGC